VAGARVCPWPRVPPAPDVDKPKDLLDWAAANWRLDKVPGGAVCTEGAETDEAV